MEILKEIPPQFDDIQAALDSESPFRLTGRAIYFSIGGIKQISKSKRRLVLNALLHYDKFRMTIEDEEDLEFVISLLKECNRIESLQIYLHTSNDIIINKLAAALETSPVVRFDLDPREHCDPILRAIKHNKTLRSLKMHLSTKLDNLDSLVGAISNENLEVFELSCLFSNEDMRSLWHAIEHVLSTHKSLKTIKPLRFDDTMGPVLGEILSKNSALQRLDLGQPCEDICGEISMNCMTLLCNGLVKNSTLQELFVSHLLDGAIRVLFASLAHDQCSISSLMISNETLTDEDIRPLVESLKTNTKLTKLEFGYCALDFNFWGLCKEIKQSKSIKELHFNTGLTSDERVYKEKENEIVNAICDLLTHNSRLTTLTLDFCWTEDQDEHCRAIGEILTKNKSLTDLTLTTCGNDGVNIICESLVNNTTLKRLHLGPIKTVQTLTGVKNLLEHNRSLRHLHIDINLHVGEIVTTAADMICEAIECNNSLVNLVLDWTEWFPNSSLNKPSQPTTIFPERSLPKFIGVLQDNHALDNLCLTIKDCYLKASAQPLKMSALPLLQRNRQLKSDLRFKVAILSHNIARSSHALTILPREIWNKILSSITSPGMEPFDDLVETIFNSYE